MTVKMGVVSPEAPAAADKLAMVTDGTGAAADAVDAAAPAIWVIAAAGTAAAAVASAAAAVIVLEVLDAWSARAEGRRVSGRRLVRSGCHHHP